uniref:Putative nucleotide-binding alpha-beta plait domain-containing protein n=1 Tax=Helianthus annuus TaxID=4232 RepID=A0A251SR34_HELAN
MNTLAYNYEFTLIIVGSIKLIRNKQTGQSERYGFIEFHTHEAADKVLQTYNECMMPNTYQVFRLNWASFSSGEKCADTGSDISIFIGDLAPDVTDAMLDETFAGRYPSVKGAKVVFDSNNGCSKGYGFVRFGDEGERTRAMSEMNGQYCSSRPMRVGVATPKKPPMQQQYGQQQYPSQGMSFWSPFLGFFVFVFNLFTYESVDSSFRLRYVS